MSTPTEQDLTRALAPQADGTEPTDDRWAQIVARGGAVRRRDRRRRTAAVLTAAALVIGAIALVQLDRTRDLENRVEFGNQPRAAADSEAIEQARRAIMLADAAAHEAEVSVVEPTSAADVAAARSATDATGAAWRAAAERRPGGSNGALAAAKGSAVTRLGTLTDLRADLDQGTIPLRNRSEQYEHLMEAALESARMEIADAPSGPAARQLTDATAIAQAGIAATTMALQAMPFQEQERRWAETGLDRLANEIAPARRTAVRAVTQYRRFEDAMTAEAAAANPTDGIDPRLVTLAVERRRQMITVALSALDQPVRSATADPVLVRAVMRDHLALRAAHDEELWATLVGDAGTQAEARVKVDAAVTTSQRSRDALRDVRRSELDCARTVADEWVTGRRHFDAGVTDRVTAARSIGLVSQAESCVLVAAGDLFATVEDWDRARVAHGLSSHVSRVNHAAALAVLRFRGDAGAKAADIRHEAKQAQIATDLFERSASPEDLPRWRADSHITPVEELVRAASRETPLPSDGRPWESVRDEMRRDLDTATALVADMAP